MKMLFKSNSQYTVRRLHIIPTVEAKTIRIIAKETEQKANRYTTNIIQQSEQRSLYECLLTSLENHIQEPKHEEISLLAGISQSVPLFLNTTYVKRQTMVNKTGTSKVSAISEYLKAQTF